MGASDGINYKTTPDWEKKVLELTGGVGRRSRRRGGRRRHAAAIAQGRAHRAARISLIGVLAGGGQVNPMPILMKNMRVQGIYVGSREMFEAMNRAIALHRCVPSSIAFRPSRDRRRRCVIWRAARISARFVCGVLGEC